jgi:ferrous iron transport protein B
VQVAGEHSYAGRIGHLLAPLLAPLGLSWRESVALLFGFVAKEIVVSTMGVLYGLGDQATTHELGHAIAAGPLTPLSAYAFMAFTLIYTPCLAAVAAIRRETNSWKWALFAVGYLLVLAWLVGFAIYQLGRLVGLG